MLAKRIIPCLDVKNQRVVKGVNFVNLADAGDPIELAIKYSNDGADELVFLDISATEEERNIFTDLITKIAKEIDIPFNVGGGIKTERDVERLLNAGADRVSINTAAVLNPSIVDKLAIAFGSQCIVIAIDALATSVESKVCIKSGKIVTGMNALVWSKEAEERGAGEIIMTSVDHDGTKNGYAVELLQEVSELVNIPVIASGGAGSHKHFLEIFERTQVTGTLAAGLFHNGTIKIPELKKYLSENNITIRQEENET